MTQEYETKTNPHCKVTDAAVSVQGSLRTSIFFTKCVMVKVPGWSYFLNWTTFYKHVHSLYNFGR